ncbi:uncharacterized protein LOC142226281 [Haematobia irritans]|uniref:uncharacterized protein LOC142226281 n=1 Tax=Haematobia irritans TaxID=7368 RepID=UPI003F4F4412
MDSYQQQQTQTEQLVNKMLSFLESSEEDGYDGDSSSNGNFSDTQTINSSHKEDDKEDLLIKFNTSNLKQKFPIWKTREIAPECRPSIRICPQDDNVDDSITVTDEKDDASISSENTLTNQNDKNNNLEIPFWNVQEIVSKTHSLSQFQNVDISPMSYWSNSNTIPDKTQNSKDEKHNRNFKSNNKTNSFDIPNANVIYSQEVRKAIYGDTTGHPEFGSKDYYQAAEKYAIYGEEFLEFPKDLSMILDVKTVPQESEPIEGNGYVQYPGSNIYEATTGLTNLQHPIYYYQMSGAHGGGNHFYQCNNYIPVMQQKPPSPNAMYLGNNGQFYNTQAPFGSQLVGNPNNSNTSTNFISNSLANAVLTASPATLYSNPMLAATQQYKSSGKPNPSLNNANVVRGIGTNNSAPVNNIGLLLYTQMLRQQIYQAQQASLMATLWNKKINFGTSKPVVGVVNTQLNKSGSQQVPSVNFSCGQEIPLNPSTANPSNNLVIKDIDNATTVVTNE